MPRQELAEPLQKREEYLSLPNLPISTSTEDSKPSEQDTAADKTRKRPPKKSTYKGPTRPRRDGRASHVAAVYQKIGGVGLGSTPEKPRRCDRCSRLHRRCARPLKRQDHSKGKVRYETGDESVDEVNGEGRCRRCTIEGVECTTKSSATRIRKSPLENEAQDPDHFQPLASTSRLEPKVEGGNLRPLSPENELRRTQQAGNLRMELISQCAGYMQHFKTSYDLDFTFNMFDEFVDAFEMCGRDPRGGIGNGGGLGLQMGRWGELKCALYCAAGSHMSKHSSILGQDPSQLRLQALQKSSSTMPGNLSGVNRSHFGEALLPVPQNYDVELNDMRVFGMAREPTVRQLWNLCGKIFEDSGILDPGHSGIPSNAEVILLVDTFARLSPPDTGYDALLHRKAIEHWRRSTVPSDFPDEDARRDCLETLVQDDVLRQMTVRALPAVTNEDIIANFSDPYLDPRIFLSFTGPELLPKARNLYENHQILWANGIAIQRLVANLDCCIQSISDSRAELFLERMLEIFKKREAWRETTFRFQEINGEVVRMQEFGKEIPSVTVNDLTMMERSCFCFLRTVEERVTNGSTKSLCPIKRSERLAKLKRVWTEASDLVDQKILEIHDTMPERSDCDTSSSTLRMRLRNFSTLPQGYRYLGRHLQRAKNPADYQRRKTGIDRTHAILNRMSYKGAHFLRWLLDLENGLNESTISSEVASVLSNPFSSCEPDKKQPITETQIGPTRISRKDPNPASAISREQQSSAPSQTEETVRYGSLLIPKSVFSGLVHSIQRDPDFDGPKSTGAEQHIEMAQNHVYSWLQSESDDDSVMRGVEITDVIAKMMVQNALSEISSGGA